MWAQSAKDVPKAGLLHPRDCKHVDEIQDYMQHLFHAQSAKEVAKAGLVHPRDRNGRLLSDRYATPGLEDALEDFRAACAAAAAETRSQLRELASRLRVSLYGIVSETCNGTRRTGGLAGGRRHGDAFSAVRTRLPPAGEAPTRLTLNL